MSRQHTIGHEVELSGRGLFTGCPVHVRFRPAPAGSGVHFVRSDQPQPIRVAARLENLAKRARRTSLKNGVVSIETVEHCLAAVRGLGIDNLDIELDNTELPGVDGSCLPFAESLQQAGVVEQDAERNFVHIKQLTRVTDGDAELVAWPCDGDRLEIFYTLDYGDTTPVGHQTFAFVLESERFLREVAPARTFVLEEEARQLREAGLGTHLSYSDILVIGPNGPIDNVYRFPNECVRHKVLDLIGDLMLAGGFISGCIYARKSGHHLNQELVRKLREQAQHADLQALLTSAPKLDVRSVQRILPHRFPMLMIDRVVEIDGDRRAIGIKNVTINEPYFEGHYPRQPMMPGVLIVEAMAQLSGILLSQKLEHTGKVAVLLSCDRVKFRRPIVPGDQLIIEAQTVRVKSSIGQTYCEARVGKELAAEGMIRFMLVDAEPT